jgi:DNA-directed RNA polymerase subunit RPC12/RpoP
MGDVVPLARPAPREPTAEGTAVCLACKHEWHAVAPTGTTDLECPACGLVRGQWRYPFSAAPGEHIFRCTLCGSENFFVRAEKNGTTTINCVGCGVDSTASIYA